MKFYLLLILSRIFTTITKPLLPIIGLFHGKVRAGLAMRKDRHQREHWRVGQSGSRPVWIHCSSGEFEYAKSIIRELKSSDKTTRILVTYFSPSYRKAIQNDPQVDLSCAMPIGGPSEWKRFFEHFNPRVLLIARTDLWPEMLYQCKKNKIDVALFSVTQSPDMKSSRSFFPRFVYSTLLEKVDQVFAVTEDDMNELKKLASKTSTEVVGDSRFDQVFYRLENKKPLKKHLKPEPPALLLGSTWPEDIKAIIPALVDAKKLGYKIMIAPHEVSDSQIRSLKSSLDNFSLSHQDYSQTERFDSDVLIIDQVGILAELYTWSQIAFVGGSFKGSVHSVMEPLAAGNLVAVGPYFKNNREALQFSREKLPGREDMYYVNEISSEADFAELLRKFPSGNNLVENQNQISTRIREEMGASKAISDWTRRSLQ